MWHRNHGDNRNSWVSVKGLFDLNRRYVFTARNDDIFRAILELDIAIVMQDAEITGVEPAACKGLLRGFWVAKIPLHHDVPAEHNLAHRLPVARHTLQGFGV